MHIEVHIQNLNHVCICSLFRTNLAMVEFVDYKIGNSDLITPQIGAKISLFPFALGYVVILFKNSL